MERKNKKVLKRLIKILVCKFCSFCHIKRMATTPDQRSTYVRLSAYSDENIGKIFPTLIGDLMQKIISTINEIKPQRLEAMLEMKFFLHMLKHHFTPTDAEEAHNAYDFFLDYYLKRYPDVTEQDSKIASEKVGVIFEAFGLKLNLKAFPDLKRCAMKKNFFVEEPKALKKLEVYERLSTYSAKKLGKYFPAFLANMTGLLVFIIERVRPRRSELLRQVEFFVKFLKVYFTPVNDKRTHNAYSFLLDYYLKRYPMVTKQESKTAVDMIHQIYAAFNLKLNLKIEPDGVEEFLMNDVVEKSSRLFPCGKINTQMGEMK